MVLLPLSFDEVLLGLLKRGLRNTEASATRAQAVFPQPLLEVVTMAYATPARVG
jgi:hypothetical protein